MLSKSNVSDADRSARKPAGCNQGNESSYACIQNVFLDLHREKLISNVKFNYSSNRKMTEFVLKKSTRDDIECTDCCQLRSMFNVDKHN